MRLMCSQDPAEVEAVKNELFRAGIATESRPNAIADTLGVQATELWVHDERDFFDASRLYEQMQHHGYSADAEGSGNYTDQAQAQPESCEHPSCQVSEMSLEDLGEPRREQLKQASALLERGIEQMFRRENELANKCASLCNQIEELQQELDQQRAALANEAENRAAMERKHSEKITSLLANQERDRREWREQLQSRDEVLLQAQERADSVAVLLQAEQAAVAGLREEIVSLQVQQEELGKSLAQAREEVAAEHAARLAAEDQAQRLANAHSTLEKQLADHKDVEQQVHAHLASLSSLCSRMNH